MRSNLLPVPEVAMRLSCTVAAVRKLIGRGDLPATRISPRRTRISEQVLEKFIERRTERV